MEVWGGTCEQRQEDRADPCWRESGTCYVKVLKEKMICTDGRHRHVIDASKPRFTQVASSKSPIIRSGSFG